MVCFPRFESEVIRLCIQCMWSLKSFRASVLWFSSDFLGRSGFRVWSLRTFRDSVQIWFWGVWCLRSEYEVFELSEYLCPKVWIWGMLSLFRVCGFLNLWRYVFWDVNQRCMGVCVQGFLSLNSCGSFSLWGFRHLNICVHSVKFLNI